MDRRDFVKSTATAAAGLSAGLTMPRHFAYASGSDTLRVGVIGCGGRGTGAARDAVMGAPGVEIVAMGDLFEDRLRRSHEVLKEAIGDRYKVTDDTSFYGFDNYQRVIESDVDIVLLATPPGFRPQHFRAAVEAGKHVFMEKPCSVDVAGIHSIIETGELAREKGLSVVAGTQYRRQPSFVEAIKRVHDGQIGDIVGGQAYYLTGPIWVIEREEGMTDLEWQCRNWYYFTWLSGDHIVEQFVHNIDTLNWIFGGPPVRCRAVGGRQARVGEEHGHIYDNFAVDYEYANGVQVTAMCRQMANTSTRIANRIVGTKGVANINPGHSNLFSTAGSEFFTHPNPGNNPYVATHTDLVESIRNGEPLNEAREVAESSLTAVMGREAAYTGQDITWDEIMSAELDLVPDELAFGPAPFPEVAIPGQTSLNRTWVVAEG